MVNSFYSALGATENERIGSVQGTVQTESPTTGPAITHTRSNG